MHTCPIPQRAGGKEGTWEQPTAGKWQSVQTTVLSLQRSPGATWQGED